MKNEEKNQKASESAPASPPLPSTVRELAIQHLIETNGWNPRESFRKSLSDGSSQHENQIQSFIQLIEKWEGAKCR